MPDNGAQLDLPLDWEGLVNEGIEARKMGDQANWRLGDLASGVETRQGVTGKSLEDYAGRVGVEYNSLRVYRYVSGQFDTRVSKLSWAHHRVVAALDDRLAWLARAEREGWTVEQLREQIKKPPVPPPPLPDGVFDVIMADPPWQYDNQIESWGPTSLHYESLSTEDICQLDELTETPFPFADNAVLFLWVTNPFIPDAFDVIEAWGFEYKTNIVWVKRNLTRPGSGFYVRGRHELLFICTRGAMVPDQVGKEPIGSVLEADVQEHSRKPDEAYALIESMYPEGHYLELFARRNRSGWTPWGNDSALLLAEPNHVH